MTISEIAESRRILQTTQSRVEKLLRKRDGIAVERSPDSSDEAQYAFDRELIIQTLDRESRLLSAVRLALRQIEDGTYGICQSCEERIGAKRLAAVPWASLCVHCQELLDQGPDEQPERDLSPLASR